MKLFKKYSFIVLMGLALAGGAMLTSCSDNDDEFSTDQYTEGVRLNVWGPSPVARGGELRFLGSGMNQVTGITLPGSGKITDLKLVSNEEVRITVPQDAEEGYLTVHTAQGDIMAKTLLTFLEPITIDQIAPTTVKPGQTIKVTGDYLNNIHEVIFSADMTNADATVAEADFINHTRTEISLIVPAEAKSGALILSDAAEEMPNWIICDELITVVTPAVNEVLTLETANPGDVITITGSNLDLVVKMVMANGEEVEYTYNADGTITFVIPDNACFGPVCLVTASGIEVVAVNIGACQPEDLVATPADGLRGGDAVAITGKNLQMVSAVTLPAAGGVEFTLEANEKLTFVFPENAQSGDVVMTLKGGGEVAVAVATAKPEVLTSDQLPAGSVATLVGKNLDLLTSITFAGGAVATVENAAADQATVTIPVTAQSGKATLNMANGETSEWEANIAEPTGAYIIAGPTDEDEVGAGTVAMFTIGNPEKLTSVLVNSDAVQYIVNGSTLYVNLPNSCGKGTVVTIVSEDGSQLEYTYNFIPATHVGMTIWEGMFDSTGWAGNQDLAWGGFDWSTVKAGTVLRAYCTPLDPSAWWCISFRHGNGWANLPGDVGAQIDTPEGGVAEIVLNQDIINDLVAEGGLVITGDGYTLTKVTLE